MIHNINRHIVITAILLFATIIFFGVSDVDTLIQDKLFDSQTHKWILDWGAQPYKLIFYDGAKRVLIIIAALVLIFSLIFRKTELVRSYKKGLIIFILSAIFIPSIVGELKSTTNMPCPRDEIRYGGIYPKVAVWEQYEDKKLSAATIKCWPGGHASGGFALLSLFFLFKTRRARVAGFVVAQFVGWSMGGYKMIIGDHFFSHNLVTMILAWLIVLILAKLTYKYIKGASKNLV